MNDQSRTTEFVSAGTVVKYTPDPSRHDPRWCREGTAIAIQWPTKVVLADTYWYTMSDAHILNEVELATIEVKFHLDDYDELKDTYGTRDRWLRYAPADRKRISSQHGLQERLFIRKGAEPDLPTQIENARVAVAEAEHELRMAEGRVTRRREELGELEQRLRDGGSDD